MKSQIESLLRSFIADSLLFTDGELSLSNDESLIDRGVIDSTGIMELVEYVSRAFEIEVPVKDISQENFDSISRLATYVRARQQERLAGGGATTTPATASPENVRALNL